MPALIDSSVFIAASRRHETLHEQAVAALEAEAPGGLATPITILSETMSFVRARLGTEAQRRFWDAFTTSGIDVVPADAALLDVAREIDRRYADAGLGFCDCTLLAACEMLGVRRILTFDKRLAMYRPTGGGEVEIVP